MCVLTKLVSTDVTSSTATAKKKKKKQLMNDKYSTLFSYFEGMKKEESI